MTTSRDPDRLITAFLEEGPNVMSDRLLDAIRDDANRNDQRAAFGPWRTLTMSRPLIAAAVIVAVLVGGLAVYTLVRPSVGTDAPTPTPTPSPVSFPIDGDLEIGTTYLHESFGEPLRFTVPSSMSDGRLAGDFNVSSQFRINDFEYGVATFYDDVQILDDLCDPTTLTATPSTPAEVETWLTESVGLTVSDQIELSVDGRTASAWDVGLGESCFTGEPPVDGAAFWFQTNEHHRIYAIPTGADTIIAVTWGNDIGGAGEEFLDEMNAATDDIVESMVFE
jgi:hypothetical protein